jgi:hypothetical protein
VSAAAEEEPLEMHEVPSLGDAIDFVALALNRKKLDAARCIIRECRLLPEWEWFEQEYRHPSVEGPT